LSHVELSRQAVRDLRKVTPAAGLNRIMAALTEQLTAEPPPDNLDIKALQGRAPWLRLRLGDWRILYRPLMREELDRLKLGEQPEGYLVARIVTRRDLERTLRTLDL
jgi:mRNA-degrading endonuclease RelE of RelBE toxin-antitoxin system